MQIDQVSPLDYRFSTPGANIQMLMKSPMTCIGCVRLGLDLTLQSRSRTEKP